MIRDTYLLQRHRDAFGASFLLGGDSHFHGLRALKSTHLMADAPSSPTEDADQARDDTTTASADWLRLALTTPPPPPPPPPPAPTPAPAPSGGRLLPMASPLFAWPAGTHASGFRAPPPLEMAVAVAPWMNQYHHHRREMPWARGNNWNIANPSLAVAGSSTVMLPPAMPDFVARQLALPPAPVLRRDVRVVSPPRRPQMGVWVVLHAARNQEREPFLPQIPKSYLRIKDGKMTVGLLMKYLVSKLGLEDESEVEITCRGQMLLPSLTLQYIRDNVWCWRETTATPTPTPTLLQDAPATDHIMMLHYGRRSSAMI